MGPPWFSGATHKEPACFAAERGLDPFGHTRALEGPFFDSKSQGQGLGLKRRHTGSLEIEPDFATLNFVTRYRSWCTFLANLGGDPFPRCGRPLNGHMDSHQLLL